MTKSVRIENADTSDHSVMVQAWRKGAEGEPDVLVSETPLNSPAAMATLTIWKEQYLVVKEV